MKKTCLILNNSAPIPEDKLNHLTDQLDLYWYQRNATDFSLDQALQECPDAQIVVCRNLGFSQEQLQRLPKLEALLITSTAYDRVDLDYCKAHQIQVFHTPDYASQAVAEHAIALMLSAVKHIPALDRSVQEGIFHPKGYLATQVQGKPVGIVGLGRIGTHIASMAKGLGMQVYYTDLLTKTFEGGTQVPFTMLLDLCQVIILSVPSNSTSFHLLDSEAFQKMQPSAFLVSVSANEVIDWTALFTALKSGQLAGAAIDLSAPIQNVPLLPNLILTPGRGWYTPESVESRLEIWINTLTHYLNGNPMHVVVPV